MYELASKILHTELRLRAELSYYTLPPLRRVAGRGSYDHDVRAGYLPGGRGSWEASPGPLGLHVCSFGRIGQIAEPACHAWEVHFCLYRADAASLSGPRLPGVLSEW